ncbi:hypothetical protein ACFX5U_11700 [Sphingobacterium sp. SG20118]|uniref:hypothetical protein n=1 Tax=Sphingobacterium sp. SG20118 TaxID=3367156 RepID=UPI0037DFBEA5
MLFSLAALMKRIGGGEDEYISKNQALMNSLRSDTGLGFYDAEIGRWNSYRFN